VLLDSITDPIILLLAPFSFRGSEPLFQLLDH